MDTEMEDEPAGSYPPVRVPFELELDGDLPEFTPIGMLGNRDDIANWQHNGMVLTGKTRGMFMLVSIDDQPDQAAARAELESNYGLIPPGQVVAAFQKRYPVSDRQGPVGIADPSWLDKGFKEPEMQPRFPYLGKNGKLDFFWARFRVEKEWRWIVYAQKNQAALEIPEEHSTPIGLPSPPETALGGAIRDIAAEQTDQTNAA